MHGFKKPQEVITNASLSSLQPRMSSCVWEFLQKHNKPLVSVLPDHVKMSLSQLGKSVQSLLHSSPNYHWFMLEC